MRLPRVHFSVGTLLFAVAVIAANCGVIRYLYMSLEALHGTWPLSWLPYGFSVGFLPLLNVALIGAAINLARRFHALRGGTGRNPRWFSAGGTFFSLHFLALGGLISIFLPEVIRSYQRTLAPITRSAENGWLKLFEQYGDVFPWIVLECLMLGFFLSGPLLVFSWIGGVLARRSAATLPRRRFRILACLVSFGFGEVALAIAMTPRPFEDERDVALSFRIVDQASGLPIRSAFLRITDPFDIEPLDTAHFPPRALTRTDGRATLNGRFKATGEQNAFRAMGTFRAWGRWLEVSASTYQTVRIPLSEILGSTVDLDFSRPQRIGLTKGETPKNLFDDLAGTYLTCSNGYGGSGFTIEADGRFAHLDWGCTGRSSLEYGFLRRNGDEIETVSIPYPGLEADPEYLPPRYRSIAWGNRLYLCSAEDQALRDFCRAALDSFRPATTWEYYAGYRRVSDDEKNQPGLPRLPAAVWLKFLRNETDLQNEEGSLRLALGSIIPRKFRERGAAIPGP